MPTRIIITRVTDADELARQIEPKMQNLGNAIARRMQRLVPKRTWALHDTITTGTDRQGGTVRTEVGVGSDEVDYWQHVERGTSRQAAQPYMRPALLQSRAGDLTTSGEGPRQHGVVARRPARRTRRSS